MTLKWRGHWKQGDLDFSDFLSYFLPEKWEKKLKMDQMQAHLKPSFLFIWIADVDEVG